MACIRSIGSLQSLLLIAKKTKLLFSFASSFHRRFITNLPTFIITQLQLNYHYQQCCYIPVQLYSAPPTRPHHTKLHFLISRRFTPQNHPHQQQIDIKRDIYITVLDIPILINSHAIRNRQNTPNVHSSCNTSKPMQSTPTSRVRLQQRRPRLPRILHSVVPLRHNLVQHIMSHHNNNNTNNNHAVANKSLP